MAKNDSDELCQIHASLFEQACALRCVYKAVEAEEDSAASEGLSAARSLLGRTIERIERLANRLDLLTVSSQAQEIPSNPGNAPH